MNDARNTLNWIERINDNERRAEQFISAIAEEEVEGLKRLNRIMRQRNISSSEAEPIKNPHTGQSKAEPIKNPHTGQSKAEPIKNPHISPSKAEPIKNPHTGQSRFDIIAKKIQEKIEPPTGQSRFDIIAKKIREKTEHMRNPHTGPSRFDIISKKIREKIEPMRNINTGPSRFDIITKKIREKAEPIKNIQIGPTKSDIEAIGKKIDSLRNAATSKLYDKIQKLKNFKFKKGAALEDIKRDAFEDEIKKIAMINFYD